MPEEQDKPTLEEILENDQLYGVLQAAIHQDPTGFAATYVDTVDYTVTPEDTEKPSEQSWRDIQKLCYSKYRNFGPLRAAIDAKADFAAGHGFSVYSTELTINEFLKDLFFSRRNRLYFQCPGWIVRMQAEGELFLLLAFDDEGTATIRVMEPSKIGESDDTGLLTNPDDVTHTLFYVYEGKNGRELIPDISIMYNSTEYLKIARGIDGYNEEETKNSRSARHRNIGGFRRFIIHWKNLTGIMEYKRDTSYFMAVLEAINLYWNAIKWELDHKKAQTAYTIAVTFEDSPQGLRAWFAWKNMSDEDKDKTGLTKPLTPGSKVVLPPGMSIDIKSPQLPRISGENQDLLNISGAGAKTPYDLWQGQSAGATYASLRASRPPFILDIENLQHKFEMFMRYEVLRACIFAKVQMGGRFTALSGKDYKLEGSYKEQWVEDVVDGEPKVVEIDVEPVEKIKFTFPQIKLLDDPDQLANGLFGSKHAGVYGAGVSAETAVKRFGIQDYEREKRKQMIERMRYGELMPGADAEKQVEEQFKKTGVEGKGKEQDGE